MVIDYIVRYNVNQFENVYNIKMMDVKNLFSFKALDKFMDDHQKNPDLFTELFEKKAKILQFIRDKKLDHNKYLKMIKKCQAQTTNDQIKGLIDIQLCLLMDGQQLEWFNQILIQTKEQYKEQQKIFKSLSQKPVQPPKQVKKQQPIKKQQVKKEPVKVQQVKQKPSKHQTMDVQKIFSLKALDSIMLTEEDDKTVYMGAYEQKQRIIELMKKGKINADIYLKTLQKAVKANAYEDIQITIQMQLQDWDTIHNKDTMEWFMDIVNQSGAEYETVQTPKYKALKSGKPIPKDDDDIDIDDVDDIDIDDNDDDIINQVDQITGEKQQKKHPSTMKPSKLKTNIQPFCFKHIDEQLEKAEKKEVFCQLFEMKLTKIDLLKKGQVSPDVYKNMLQSIVSSTDDDDLKMAAQAELDLDLGDVNQFFEAAVNATGGFFQKQQAKYNELKGKKGSVFESKQTEPQEEQKPSPSDIVSFSVIVRFLQKYSKSYDYCLQLKEKGNKLLELVETKRLASNQYKLFLQRKLPELKNKQMKSIMKEELRMMEEGNASKVFKQLVQRYVDKIKVSHTISRGSYGTSQIDESKVNGSDNRTKIQYLLRKLSKYQSLNAYYKNNNLKHLAEKLKPQYDSIRKKVMIQCDKIGKDDSETNVTVFAEENIPQITFGIFHRQTKSTFSQKIDKYVQFLQNQSKQYAQYSKRLKKGSNRENIENSQKAIKQNLQTIKYLQGLKKQTYVPLPTFEQQKLTLYNLDLNKLTENQIQIIVTNIEGIQKNTIFQLYVIDFKNHRFRATVKEGGQQQIKVTLKIDQNIMDDIIKGSDKRYVGFKLLSKGWFSQSKIDEDTIDLNFIRNNNQEGRMELKDGIAIDYIIKVQKPKRPIVTEINGYKIEKHPEYEHTKFIETEFLKKMMPFEKPTQSQIR